MNEKKKDPRWLSFLQGVFLWAVVGALGYGLVIVRDLHPGSCLTERQMAFINFSSFLVGVCVLVAF